jgi:hypothetical protein
MSDPYGINCSATIKLCTEKFSAGTLVKLNATPNAGFYLKKWINCPNPSGDSCSVAIDKARTIKPDFRSLPKYSLKVTKNALGSITSDPIGLKCPDKKKSCSAKFTKGTQVTLTPIPQAGRSFAGWTGACSRLNACTVVMDGGKGVGAMFQ